MSIPILVAGVIGCSSKPVDPIVELRGISEQLCACADVTCAEALKPRIDVWTGRHATSHGETPVAKDLMRRVAVCRDNAAGDALSREAYAKLVGYRDRACACTDAACATAVQNEHAAWLRTNIVRFSEMKSTPLQVEEGNRIATETQKCVRNALNATDKLERAARAAAKKAAKEAGDSAPAAPPAPSAPPSAPSNPPAPPPAPVKL